MKPFLSFASLGFACLYGLATASASDVLTNRYDNARSGLVSTETALTPANVKGLKLLFQKKVDGAVYAQPLCVSNQLVFKGGVSQGLHDLLIVATENGSVYAFDAVTGTTYWKVSVLTPGDTAVSANDPHVLSKAIKPRLSITATPVIDRNAGSNGRIFVLAMETDGLGHYDYKLHALDLATGQDALTPVAISASVSGAGPATTFVAQNQHSRPALLLANGIIYTGFCSFDDRAPYSGWLIGYLETNLSQAVVFNPNPNGSPTSNHEPDGSGSGIWGAGGGISADNNGNIFLAVGNGPFDQTLDSNGFPANSDFDLASSDEDFGSGAVVLLPDIVDTNGKAHSLAVTVIKNSSIYLLDRNNLGKFNSSIDNSYQTLSNALASHAYTSPVFFKNALYLCGASTALQRFSFDFTNPNKPILSSAPNATTSTIFADRGCIPSISSNGTTNGIVWAYETRLKLPNAILHAFDARTLTELFNSGTLLAPGVKFAVPTIFNGKVYAGTMKSVAAFGL